MDKTNGQAKLVNEKDKAPQKPQWNLTRSFSEANVRDLNSYMDRMNAAGYSYGRGGRQSDDTDDDNDDAYYDEDNDEDDENDDEDVDEEESTVESTKDEDAIKPAKKKQEGGQNTAQKNRKAGQPALDIPPIVEEFLRKLFIVSGFETPQWLVDIICFFHENLEDDSRQKVDTELGLLSAELENTSMNSTPQDFINACGAAFQLLGNVVSTVAEADLEEADSKPKQDITEVDAIASDMASKNISDAETPEGNRGDADDAMCKKTNFVGSGKPRMAGEVKHRVSSNGDTARVVEKV